MKEGIIPNAEISKKVVLEIKAFFDKKKETDVILRKEEEVKKRRLLREKETQDSKNNKILNESGIREIFQGLIDNYVVIECQNQVKFFEQTERGFLERASDSDPYRAYSLGSTGEVHLYFDVTHTGGDNNISSRKFIVAKVLNNEVKIGCSGNPDEDNFESIVDFSSSVIISKILQAKPVPFK